MKDVLLVAAIVFIVVLGFVCWMIRDILRDVVLISVLALALIGVIVASSFPLRALRRKDGLPEVHHFYHDGTRVERHTIDNRQVQPTFYQLPQQAGGAVWPDLLRAAWTAGRLEAPGADQSAPVDLAPDDWNGNITS